MNTVNTLQVNHYQQLQNLESELKEYQDSAKAIAEKVKDLEASPDLEDRANLINFRKVLNNDLKMIRLYRAEISKIKRGRPGV